jgi:hypothetical protein
MTWRSFFLVISTLKILKLYISLLLPSFRYKHFRCYWWLLFAFFVLMCRLFGCHHIFSVFWTGVTTIWSSERNKCIGLNPKNLPLPQSKNVFFRKIIIYVTFVRNTSQSYGSWVVGKTEVRVIAQTVRGSKYAATLRALFIKSWNCVIMCK